MTIDVDPVIFRLGPLAVHWYGIIMMIAVVVGTVIFSRQLGRKGISRDHALGIAVIGVPCAVIGARLFHILENLGFYWHHPSEIVGWQLIGLAIYGVLTGGLAGLVIYCRWKKLPVLRVLDCTALAFPVGQIIGKCANIINGDTWGNPTSLPWGFKYVNPASLIPDNLLGVPTHPNPVYEQLWLLVVLAVLLLAVRRIKTDGLAILLYLGMYSVGRFFLSYFRVNKIIVLGLREAQIVALVVIVLAIPLAWFLVWRSRRLRAASPLDAAPAEPE
jgi:phosphatidylglycerol---prolipoprotein diacylglyceryl transferase